MDADPHLQPDAGVGIEHLVDPPDLLDDGEARPHRALGVVLVRLRPAEIDQRAVADVAREVAAIVVDRLGDGALVGTHQVAHLLGIEPARDLGRANHVAEQQDQEPPLAADRHRRRPDQRIGRLRRGHRGAAARAESGIGLKLPAAGGALQR